MPRITLFFIVDSIQTVFSNENDTLKNELNLNFSLKVNPEKQVTFVVETPEVYQPINPIPVVHGATDFNPQLVPLEALFTREMYELKREINRLRENINKWDQNAGKNNLYQEYKIKNYYLEQKKSFLK